MIKKIKIIFKHLKHNPRNQLLLKKWNFLNVGKMFFFYCSQKFYKNSKVEWDTTKNVCQLFAFLKWKKFYDNNLITFTADFHSNFCANFLLNLFQFLMNFQWNLGKQ